MGRPLEDLRRQHLEHYSRLQFEHEVRLQMFRPDRDDLLEDHPRMDGHSLLEQSPRRDGLGNSCSRWKACLPVCYDVRC